MVTTYQTITHKHHDSQSLANALMEWRRKGERIVFTNGCFDLLHLGHVAYLSEAADLGDRLVIGVNSDDSVKRLKGQERPFQDFHARSTVLSALLMTDAVTGFEEDTPYRLIQSINPDVLVKGGDYRPEDVVGADHVRAYGGKVVCIPLTEGYATSLIARKFSR